jgi:Cof subfamily protein (haloacid dehalogenase superfamily)
MFYRLIALDVDGTLLNSKSELTPATCEAVRHIHEQGTWISITSGRSLLGVMNIIRRLGLDVWYVSSGGARVGRAENQQVLLATTVERADALTAIYYARKLGAAIFMETADRLFWEGPREYLDQLLSVAGLPVSVVPDVAAFLDGNPLKLTLRDEHPTLQQIETALRPRAQGLNLVFSTPTNLEITRQGVTKGTALSLLAAHLQVPRAQVAAVGNGENDIPMFQAAGLSIAMGNAPEAVQRAADRVAPSNDHDGIVWAMSQIEASHVLGA